MNTTPSLAGSSAHPRRTSELEMNSQSYASDSDSGDEGKGKGGKGKTKEDKEKKGTGINRVSRACNHCRRMKMRCIGAEDPPCKRCKNAGLDCVMEKPRSANPGGEGDDRIKSLENQVSSLQSTLSELVSTLRQGMSSPHTSSSRISPNPPSDAMFAGSHHGPGHAQGQHGFAGDMGVTMGMGGTLNQSQLGMMSNSPHGSIEMVFGVGGHGGHGQGGHGQAHGQGHAGSTGSGPTPPFFNTAQKQQHYLQQQQHQQHQQLHHSPTNHVRFSSAPDVHWQPIAHDSNSPFGSLDGLMASGATSAPGGSGSGEGGTGGAGTSQSGVGAGAGAGPHSEGTDDWTQRLGPRHPDTLRSTQHLERDNGTDRSNDPYQSIPPTRSGSLTPDDLLAPEDIINPLGAMSSMAGLVEAAVKASKSALFGRGENDMSEASSRGGEGSGGGVDGGGSGKAKGLKREADNGAGSGDDRDNTDTLIGETGGTSAASASSRPTKRSRHSPILPSGPIIHEVQHLPPQSSKDRERGKREKKKTHIHAYPDIVEEGLIEEEEGRELMAIFYAGSSNFIPCFDPSVDTWERVRSPFSITAIVMAGARVRDGGGPISDVQRLAREHAQRIAVGTLFNPVARIEAVQAMILLAAFSENGWLPGGHAVRMAIDMGLNRSFLHLLRTGVGKGKSAEELEEERYLVVQSRIWFCLYLIEHQMAYGMGRPAILREDETIHQCRRLLEHPMSITSDARLVSTVELMALRAPLHIELTAAPDLPITENTMRRLRQANADFDAWERYWDRVLGDRFGKGRGDFFRESLIIQRQYAELFVNSQLLRGIKEPTDVVNMPEEKRALAIRAMRNAQRCIEICLRGENYRNGLRYAVHYTHVCAAFAASFLIRIARLFPHELNLKKTAKDVDELANVLSEVPAGRYARSLRLILRRARKAKVIPAQSRPSSPNRNMPSLPSLSPFAQPSNNNSIPNRAPAQSPFSPSQLINPEYLKTPTPGPSGPGMGSGMLNMPTPRHQGQGQGMGFSPRGTALLNQGVLPDLAFTPNTAALFNSAGQIVDDSPSSGGGADLFEFDQLFAVETMERAGMTQVGDQLPLFLDGHSLGGQGTDSAPFVGMEQFFLPPALDNRLGGPGAAEQNGSAIGNFDPNLLAEEIWW